MGMSGNKGMSKAEEASRGQADVAIGKADTIDPALQKERNYWMAIKDWQMGVGADGKKVAVDVRNIPGGDVDIGLYNAAKQSHDQNRIGTGIGTATDNANPTFSAARDKETEMEKSLNASGMLEGVVENKVNNADAALTGLGTQQANQNLQVAGLRNQAYNTFLNRPQGNSFLQQLALAGLSGASSAATAAAGRP